jgi:hypothetical protein
MVSIFLMLRALLLTSHCVGSFQWPTVPHAGQLLELELELIPSLHHRDDGEALASFLDMS